MNFSNRITTTTYKSDNGNCAQIYYKEFSQFYKLINSSLFSRLSHCDKVATFDATIQNEKTKINAMKYLSYPICAWNKNKNHKIKTTKNVHVFQFVGFSCFIFVSVVTNLSQYSF